MSTYRTVKGYSVKSVTSDPDNAKEGQVWYNDTIKKIKGVISVAAAWSSGGNLGTGRHSPAGAGTQTAGLEFGGNADPPITAVSEEYNGTAWSEGNDLNTAKNSHTGFGTQTAALSAAGATSTGQVATAEEYNGTSWSNVNSANTARNGLAGGGDRKSVV